MGEASLQVVGWSGRLVGDSPRMAVNWMLPTEDRTERDSRLRGRYPPF